MDVEGASGDEQHAGRPVVGATIYRARTWSTPKCRLKMYEVPAPSPVTVPGEDCIDQLRKSESRGLSSYGTNCFSATGYGNRLELVCNFHDLHASARNL